jgi:hypothetical protein
MLDAADHQAALLAAVRRWRPDADRLAAGDLHLRDALCCYASELSDAELARRLFDQAGISTDVDTPFDAAIALARHCATVDLPLAQIIAILAYLAAEVPCWPDADDLAAIATSAIAECQQ